MELQGENAWNRPAKPVIWTVSTRPVGYDEAVKQMEALVGEIYAGRSPEHVWLLEHPPLYTAGTSAKDSDLLDIARLPVFRTGRGGQYTYHGPGQRLAYVMLDLSRRGRDVRHFVHMLEQWIILTLAEFNVVGETRPDRIGVWVRHANEKKSTESKIAALGIRIRHWVTFHGVSLNVNPELSHYEGIVPCGVTGHGVTSLAQLGVNVDMRIVDEVLRRNFESQFGPTQVA